MPQLTHHMQYGNLFKTKKMTFFDILKIETKDLQKRHNRLKYIDLGQQSTLNLIH